MKEISSKKLAEVLNYHSPIVNVKINNIVTDSRMAKKGDLFIAIKGEKFDAHNFVKDVIDKGVELVVVDHKIEGVPDNRQIVVKDTLDAYGKIGAYNRSLFKGVVIGLTGSAGKTTTKEELKFILSKFAKVYATTGNHNNYIGVPLTLCEMDMDADFAIIEMGMSAKGEISRLVSYVKPDMAIITNVYPMHIEFFDKFEGIAEAKAEIFETLRPNSPVFINEDTNFVSILEKRATEHKAKIIKFGKQNHPNVDFRTSQEGEHHLYNAWAVLSIVKELGLDVEKAASYIKDFGALEGRGKLWDLRFDKGAYTLIDDSYSGQPEAMKLAIEALDKMKCLGRKIAVLGKMAELGETSKSRHIEIGEALAKTNIDIVIGVCPEMKDMLAQLKPSQKQYYFENKEGLDEILLNKLLQNNDTVLIKGARYSSKLYQIAEVLIKNGIKL